MIDEFAKEYLHDDLRWIREAVLWKLDGRNSAAARLSDSHCASAAGVQPRWRPTFAPGPTRDELADIIQAALPPSPALAAV